jgi:DDE domain
VRTRGKWAYLYRAVDRAGKTVDFRLSARRDVPAAKAFLAKAIRTQGRAPGTSTPDGYAASHRAVREMKIDGFPKRLLAHPMASNGIEQSRYGKAPTGLLNSMSGQAARIRTIIARGYPGWLGKPSSASTSERLDRVQIRISAGGASAPKGVRNADTQGRLSSKVMYIGVAQQFAIIRLVFEGAVSLIAWSRSAPRVQAMRSRRNTMNSVPPSTLDARPELADAARRWAAVWQSSQ